MGRIYAGTLGYLALVTIVARGLIAGAAPGQLLWQASLLMFVFAGIGWIAGTIDESTVNEAVQRIFDAEVAAAEASKSENVKNSHQVNT